MAGLSESQRRYGVRGIPITTMRVLLTGAASALGGAVAAALAADGHSVRATDTAALPSGAPPALDADFHQGTLTDPQFVAPLVAGIDAVVHLAPLTLVEHLPPDAPGEALDAAARGTHVLCKAAVDSGVGAMVQASTLAVMDAYDDALEVNEQWRPRPRPDPAEMAPYLAELVAREFTRDVQIDAPPRIVCLRFGRLGGDPSETRADSRALDVSHAAQAVMRALAALHDGARQRGHRWHLYHVAAPDPAARYTSAAAQRALGYAPEAGA